MRTIHAASAWNNTSTTARAMVRNTFILVLAFFSAGLTSVAAQPSVSTQKYPNVVDVKIKPSGADTFNFDVTVSSPYDTPQRYADAIRVMGKDGQVFGERKLLHDHATSNHSPAICMR
ncbi:MAG: hypothetical protein IV108_06850 [Burkholderiales bacterium]|nr:hypothetical protein [Burkholderiales bacterium]